MKRKRSRHRAARSSKQKQKDPWALHSEPQPWPEDRVEWGGTLMYVAGWTSGGAPYGTTLDEFREMNARERPRPGWARAKVILERVASANEDERPEIGWVRMIGRGLSRDVFSAEVSCSSQLEAGVYVVMLPRADTPGGDDDDLDARVVKEATLLHRLAGRDLPIRVPRAVAVVREGGHRVLVREHLAGAPADLRAGRTDRARPWDLVAEVASAIHAVDLDDAGFLGGFATRRAHAEHRLSDLAGRLDPDDTVAAEAVRWCKAHLPPDEPSSLVHGDLLGQNILLAEELWRLERTTPPGVIDWEYATRGDPAYELAIVTRGVRKPFGLESGLGKLLEAYNARGGPVVQAHEVRVHELCLHLGWLLEDDSRDPVEERRNRLRSVLRRL